LKDDFLALAPHQRRIVHDTVVEQALARWRDYVQGEGEIRYRESVVGTEQVVDPRLPGDAWEAARSGRGSAQVDARYGEPRAALQDGDLSFPEPIAFAYDAVYNYFRKYGLGQDVDDWLIVNQAGSSDPDERRWAPTLQRAIAAARRAPER
jgi:hypothetical protein